MYILFRNIIINIHVQSASIKLSGRNKTLLKVMKVLGTEFHVFILLHVYTLWSTQRHWYLPAASSAWTSPGSTGPGGHLLGMDNPDCFWLLSKSSSWWLQIFESWILVSLRGSAFLHKIFQIELLTTYIVNQTW
jgi:hypothetical protein